MDAQNFPDKTPEEIENDAFLQQCATVVRQPTGAQGAMETIVTVELQCQVIIPDDVLNQAMAGMLADPNTRAKVIAEMVRERYIFDLDRDVLPTLRTKLKMVG